MSSPEHREGRAEANIITSVIQYPHYKNTRQLNSPPVLILLLQVSDWDHIHIHINISFWWTAIQKVFLHPPMVRETVCLYLVLSTFQFCQIKLERNLKLNGDGIRQDTDSSTFSTVWSFCEAFYHIFVRVKNTFAELLNLLKYLIFVASHLNCIQMYPDVAG